MLLILLCDELLGYSVILFALIRAFYLIFKGNYGTKTLLLWWGNFVIAIITTRMIIYLYHFFESMLCTTGLIFYTIVNLTKSDFNIFNLSQRFKSDFVFNIYLSCKIFIYGITKSIFIPQSRLDYRLSWWLHFYQTGPDFLWWGRWGKVR